jgi:putative flippase GtrA
MTMTAKLFPRKALRAMQGREPSAESRQATDPTAVAPNGFRGNSSKASDGPRGSLANSSRDNRMPSDTAGEANSISLNAFVCNDLRGVKSAKSGAESDEKRERWIAYSTLLRWCKFNLVGGIGILVQFVALFFLRGVMHFNYLFATAIAVEAAVVHNFVWHEQFTWADRVRGAPRQVWGAEAHNILSRLFAALKRCATQRLGLRGPCEPSGPIARCGPRERWISSKPYGPSLRRFLRFNLTNGAVSILGNLALMRVMVGQGHMNYLLANGIAIALCSVANFLVSENWVFARE